MAAARTGLGLGQRLQAGQNTVSKPKAVEFFREVCRCLPWIVTQYKLEELTSVSKLRKSLSQMFRQNEDIQQSEVIDLLIYKGREELEMILMQHKQRHHLIDGYIENPALEKVEKPSQMSPFLEKFYKGN